MSATRPLVFDRARRLAPNLPFVKVCGLTRASDVEMAVAAGASAVGFVFWPRSPRAVGEEAAQAMRAFVPPNVLVVGVFVDAPAVEVMRIVAHARLDVVQLHGDEPVSVRDTLRVPVIKAIVGGRYDVAWMALEDPGVVLLSDARDEERRGGTGRVADWDAAGRLARTHAVVLAGGLSAENVADATRRVGPMALDVSSGVETAPGVKDATRMHAFFAAVRAMERDGR